MSERQEEDNLAMDWDVHNPASGTCLPVPCGNPFRGVAVPSMVMINTIATPFCFGVHRLARKARAVCTIGVAVCCWAAVAAAQSPPLPAPAVASSTASAPATLAPATLAPAIPQLDEQPWLRPYTGVSRSDIDATTLDGKVLCGYQGWFNTPGDGTPLGFRHWREGAAGVDKSGKPAGHFRIDMWPDTSEYAAADLCEVPGYTMPDGSPARLYSGFHIGPTLVHFRWMREHGIDGVFLSRFIGETRGRTTGDPVTRHVNMVLANVREAAHREGRTWAMMLDLSMGPDATSQMVVDDWKFLCDEVKIRDDSRYLHHNGKPVVLLWGLGFKDRPWTPEQAEELINFFKNDPKYGGVHLIGGVDPSWRTLKGDSRTDPAWARVYRMFDAISPWNAGRYRDDASMDAHRKAVWEPDLTELATLNKGYMPTAFPGFSWDNMHRAKPGTTLIPRRGGEFYWKQFAIFKALNVRTVFVGMFDEVDEGTAIYKVADRTPTGEHFVTNEGHPADYYLRLTGAATRMMRGETPFSKTIPATLRTPAADLSK